MVQLYTGHITILHKYTNTGKFAQLDTQKETGALLKYLNLLVVPPPKIMYSAVYTALYRLHSVQPVIYKIANNKDNNEGDNSQGLVGLEIICSPKRPFRAAVSSVIANKMKMCPQLEAVYSHLDRYCQNREKMHHCRKIHCPVYHCILTVHILSCIVLRYIVQNY